MKPVSKLKGRGAVSNRAGRYNEHQHEAVDDGWQRPSEPALPRTEVTEESPRNIIAHNQSPDLPFDQSINPYRGCEHGCIYCYARPTHAYLGLSPGLDFETKLTAKPSAAKLLRRELQSKHYRCSPVALGANTDPYQPIERQLRITREILEVLNEFHHPLTITTKSALVERDIDLLAPMAEQRLVQVNLSVTTLQAELARKLEPRASAPHRRLQAIETLSQAGVPVNVMVAPVIPVLTDPELESILQAAARAGACSAAYMLIRLPLEIADLFEEWLRAHFPDKADHVLNRIRDTRRGRANDPRFSKRMSGEGIFAELIGNRFRIALRKTGLDRRNVPPLDTTLFRDQPQQMELF